MVTPTNRNLDKLTHTLVLYWIAYILATKEPMYVCPNPLIGDIKCSYPYNQVMKTRPRLKEGRHIMYNFVKEANWAGCNAVSY
jgi:hypothetical protein